MDNCRDIEDADALEIEWDMVDRVVEQVAIIFGDFTDREPADDFALTSASVPDGEVPVEPVFVETFDEMIG